MSSATQSSHASDADDRDACRWRPHPWHGLPVGADPPARVNAYIEMTPFDLVKYEIDKATGYLHVDRPQQSSSLCPSLYGFIPRTLCGPRTAELNSRAERGDGDPLDICVISEWPSVRSEVIVVARVVGGIRTLDGGNADDKIISILDGDTAWGEACRLSDLAQPVIDRLCHYFATYKLTPDRDNPVEVQGVLQREEALDVVRAAVDDYACRYGRAPGDRPTT